MEYELKPCPYCGSVDVYISSAAFGRHYVLCRVCLMRGPEMTNMDSAKMAWNGLPRALVWSSDPPTEPGFWWWELLGHKGVDLIQDPEKRVVKDYRAKWAGPIPEPKEAKR